MRVLLTGTSNSIITGGISRGLERTPLVRSFTNASYGASGTVAIGDHLRNIDFSQHDVCVIDYFVNEEVFLFLGETTLERAVSNVMALVDAASRAGCLPVIVILPTLQRLGLDRPLEEALLEKLAPLGVPYFNTYDFIEGLVARQGFEAEELFLDNNHVLRRLGDFIGFHIVDILSRLDPDRFDLVETDYSYWPLAFAPYQDLEVEGEGASEGAQEVSRASRLMSCDLLSIPPGARITARHAGQGEIAGITYNQARTWGEIGVAGAPDPSLKITTPAHFDQERELVLVSRPLHPTAKFEDGRAEIAYTAGPAAPEGKPPVRLEMRGLILRDREHPKPLAVRRYKTGPLALDARVQARREGILATNLRVEIDRNNDKTGARAAAPVSQKEAR